MYQFNTYTPFRALVVLRFHYVEQHYLLMATSKLTYLPVFVWLISDLLGHLLPQNICVTGSTSQNDKMRYQYQ
jgi:hypothetical protein